MRPVRRRNSGRYACTSGNFLIVVAAVWVLVLVIFSAAIFVQERGVQGGEAQMRGTAQNHHEEVAKLQRTVNDLRASIDKLSSKYDTPDRLQLRRAMGEEAPPDLARNRQQQPQHHHGDKDSGAEKAPAVVEAKGAVYDSNTSPVPLVDPTVLTRMDLPFEGDPAPHCGDRRDGDKEILDRMNVWEDARMGAPRILCMSYTLSKAHGTAVNNIRHTWGKKCDGYLAMSDVTNPEVPSVDIKHDGPEAYDNMWQKVRSIWLYVHKHHRRDFDFFLIGGDDLFIVVENLRKYLLSDEIMEATGFGSKPIYLGRRFLPPKDTVGSGLHPSPHLTSESDRGPGPLSASAGDLQLGGRGLHHQRAGPGCAGRGAQGHAVQAQPGQSGSMPAFRRSYHIHAGAAPHNRLLSPWRAGRLLGGREYGVLPEPWGRAGVQHSGP
jgi:hypothetical protein